MSLEIFLSQVVPVRTKLYRFAYRLLGNEEDAKDITQDALMKVWAMQGKMMELQNLEAWCMRVTRNLALDKIKSRKYRVADTLDKASEMPAQHQTSPHAATERNEVMNKVHTAINSLPEKYRTIMQLRDMEGLSYQEIADTLDIDVNDVKVNLHRARKSVREKLQNQQVYGL
ncbi:RNA polymerase sigma factor [Chitinophaga sp. Cy-1792]|uniref:RNA polymerase sigma factor n=1 Tax=Chitinophaga sp. Cy-1792 TaxID=2608339 RepID=UPI00141EAEBB|nr:RNA polymerase sigma factor [Chitinophaga sp. Cy-1792]NIG56124.1 RNA polymerase sigma factor [Chitinophaga sp. Cy-1792]